jgi:hypothetical protein
MSSPKQQEALLSSFYAAAGSESSVHGFSGISCDCLVRRHGNAADHPMRVGFYPTDLTDAQWAQVMPLVPIPFRPSLADTPLVGLRTRIVALVHRFKRGRTCLCAVRVVPKSEPVNGDRTALLSGALRGYHNADQGST